MSTNFFSGWTVEYIPQSQPSAPVSRSTRLRATESSRSRKTNEVYLIMQSKVKLTRKTDNLTLSEGDAVYFAAPGIARELWYVYRIDVNEIMGKISVHGILLQDNKTLQEDYNATIPLTNSLTREISDAYEIVMIPEIKDFFTNATYTHINIHSFNYYEDNKKEFENSSEEHKFVNKIFVSNKGKFVPLDFDELVSQNFPGCTTTLDKMLYLIDQESHNEKKNSKKSENKGKIAENKSLTKQQLVTRVNLPKEPKKKRQRISKPIPSVDDDKKNDFADIGSSQETESDVEENSSFNSDINVSKTPHIREDIVALDTEIKNKSTSETKNSATKEIPSENEEDVINLSVSKDSKVNKRSRASSRETRRVGYKPALNRNIQVHKAFTAADFTNSYQRMTQNRSRKGGYIGANNNSTPSDTVESFRQRMSTSEETMISDDQLDAQAEKYRYAVPGRENEFRNLYSRIASFVNTGTGSSIYLSGVPGTGKTFTVKKTIESLFNKNPNMFLFAEINGFKLINLDDCYESLCDKLNIQISPGSTALTTLQNFFTSKDSKKVVLLLDEIDVLLKHDAEKLYNFFNWPYLANSKLFVVAVGNNLNLSEQLDAKTNSRLGAMNIIAFSPYSQQNLADILRHTLNEFIKNNRIYVEKSSGSIALFSSSASAKFAERHKFFFQLLKINFTEEAITFLSRSAATSTSDVRTAKGIGFAAIEMVEEEYGRTNGVIYNYEKTIDMDSFPDDNEFQETEFEIIERDVTSAVAAAAKTRASSSSAVEYVKNLSFLNQFILYVALNTFKAYNNTTIPFTTLVDRVETLMDKYSITKVMKASYKMMQSLNDMTGVENVRLFDWDASLNTLEGIGIISFSKSLNERGNSLVLKNVESIEEGLKTFEKSLL
ncbi:uncharacterized protein HGUI_03256 [Hanseniaspora guilliermondii]|uniref:Origin recognition complex subunit 1 n=1 Tax=Hanseniaspora guilliermondii TaxID=56406 RepID=A0A1L0B3J5_9ASCO|nr:uncharacterized protein HGUI_03256 [Hanseniaspora guilliermondii]